MTQENDYLAYSDESNHNDGRYRAISVITLNKKDYLFFNNAVSNILQDSNVNEFKWNKIKTYNQKNVALKFIDLAIKNILSKKIRIDTLIWDIEDSRHKDVINRDDRANFARLYFHLLKNLINNRWEKQGRWFLYPDQQSINWDELKSILECSISYKKVDNITSSYFDIVTLFMQEISSFQTIKAIKEIKSEKEPIIQLADLFAGLSVSSYRYYEKYRIWEKQQSSQLELFHDTKLEKFSKGDNARFEVISYLKSCSQKNRLGVSLTKKKGFFTHNPKNSPNFWLYEPQSNLDKAPQKNITELDYLF